MKKIFIRIVATIFCIVMMIGLLPSNIFICFNSVIVANAADELGVISDINSGWTWPLEKNYTHISSRFGKRKSGYHQGVDIDCCKHKTIYAARKGIVRNVDWNDSMGWYVSIEHGTYNDKKIYTTYMHMVKKSSVSVGQMVYPWTELGIVGNTGHTSGGWVKKSGPTSKQTKGYHLHFQICKGSKNPAHDNAKNLNNNYYDPLSFSYDYNHKEVDLNPTGRSEIKVTNLNIPQGTLPKGKSFGINGDVYSKYKITKVVAGIVNSNNEVVYGHSCTETRNSYYCDLHGKINNAIAFGDLLDGNYTFVVGVYDEKDYKSIPYSLINSSFVIGKGGTGSSGSSSSGTPFAPPPDKPTFQTPVAVEGGYKVKISIPSGTDVYYSIGNKNNINTKYSNGYEINVKSTSTIFAVAKNKNGTSDTAQKTITVNRVATPEICKPKLTSKNYSIELRCDTVGSEIFYTLDATTPTKNSYKYNAPITLTSGATIRAIAVKKGCINSLPTDPVTVKPVAPTAPSVEIPTGSEVAVGDPIEVRWTKKDNVTSYNVRIYKGNSLVKTVSVTGAKYVYIPDTAGFYTFGVDAINFKGTASSNASKRIEAKSPVTVRFVDIDGTLLKQQKVKYGYSASVPEITPKRKGYVFREWNSRNYLNVKADTTITAVYDKQKYVVRFIDENGKVAYPQQEVKYLEAVVLPANPTTSLVGYVFSGWRVISSDPQSALNYNKVDSNLTLQAVFDWDNKDLPVGIQSINAQKTDVDSYTVDVTLNNGDNKKTYCRMLVTLKTSSGKTVRTVYKDVILTASTNNQNVGTTTIICDKVASQVEINIVGLDDDLARTGGTYANARSAPIVDQVSSYWSGWSANQPANGVEYQTKTMYRYRDRSTTDSTASSLSGWTRYGTPTTTYGSWSANKTTTSKPTASDTLQIVSQSTTYNYYHWCNYYSSKWHVDSIAYGSKSVKHTYSTTNKLPSYTINGDKGGKANQAFGYKGCTNQHACSYNFYVWWLDSSVTTYTYQTRSKTVTYHYEKWSNWTNWSDTAVSAVANKREVQTTTYYRYKITNNVSESAEDNTGVQYNNSNISLLGTPGVIPNTDRIYSNKKATVIVYKASLNDPTANYIEYVGQITIGSGNTYDLNFVTAESPDDAESNFTVSLAVEGQTSLFNIGTIYCSKSKYDVEFFADGESISKQLVQEGDDAVVPEPPEIPGKRFIGWDNDTTNVIAPRVINAYYADETYSVVFVDFETDYISMEQYNYGDVISVPSLEDFDGRTFIGWEGLDEDNPIVTEHAIYVAKYETGSFTVIFDDGYGNILSEQIVEYGETAELPDAPEIDGLVFMGWKQDQTWWNVKSEMIVTPIWVYEGTVAEPDINVENLYFGGEISAEVDTEGATLYYAIDDGSGVPPIIVLQQEPDEEYEETELNDSDSDEVIQTSQPLNASLLDIFITNAFAEEVIDDEEEINDEYGPVPQWIEYDDSMILDEDVTIYFYAAADNMNNSEIVTLNYKYEPVMNPYEDHTGESYTVIFLDDDGFVLDEQTVNYFEDAVAPAIDEREGYVFVGWDCRFDHIIDNLEVTAQYVPEDEFVTFTLNTEQITLTAGDTYSLDVTVVNEPEDMGEIIWQSKDSSVATVSTDGLVLTKSAGETVITARTEKSDYYAECKVTVLPNSDETVVLINNSKLTLENGLLTQIPIASNHEAATVGDIKGQLASQNARVFDANGNELSDSSIVTTDTQIRIIVDDIAVDAVIVIVSGDYDCNGKVNNRDASRIMRYLVNKETPNESQIYASDVNKDGSVNNRDAAMVSRYLVGKETL